MWFASLTLSLLGSSSWLKQERGFFTAKKNRLTETSASHVYADGIRPSFSQWVTPQKVQPFFC
jgi:hypothetical protein